MLRKMWKWIIPIIQLQGSSKTGVEKLTLEIGGTRKAKQSVTYMNSTDMSIRDTFQTAIHIVDYHHNFQPCKQ